MKADQIFFGPILRRSAPDLVVIAIATTAPMTLRFSVKEAAGAVWLGHDDAPFHVEVSPTLHFYFARVRPDRALPTGRLLSYAIAVPGLTDWDYAPFEAIVASDGLAYFREKLPTFFLQRRGAQLTAIYGSCRKIHDDHVSKLDALAEGDAMIARDPRNFSSRPAILCLGGDQIYADDVHDLVQTEVLALSRKIQSPIEVLPGPGRGLGSAKRKLMLKRYAKFTSDDLDNQLARFTEFLALYGLMWNRRNWRSEPPKLKHFFKGLPAVRRLLANVATYMIFDDHDVTDDWNLSVRWQSEVTKTELGKRIVTNALMAYWLCQDYGNDPDRYANRLDNRLAALISGRARNYSKAEETFAALKLWEFATPTAPLVYFVDTRTRRGFEDEPHRRDPTAPAFLKTLEAWSATTARLKPLLDRQDPSLPLVLVTAAPVFGFGLIELFQGLLSLFSDYFVDYENWSANEEHFAVFLDLMRGRDVVLLSGDVHYAFTSTARFVIFDSPAIRRSARGGSLTGSIRPLPVGPGATYRPISEARFIQLTSSALKNYAKTILRWLGNASDPGLGTITTADGDTQRGSWENGVFIRQEVAADGSGVEWAVRTLEEVRPSTFFQQKINDALNTGYIEDRNLGVVQFQGRTVRHSFRTPGKSPTPQMTWDFNNQKYWT